MLNLINKLVDWVCKLLMAVMVFTITCQIVMRYGLDSPIMWGEELSRISYAWFCFFGVALATWDEAHLKVDFFLRKLPKPIQAFIQLSIKIIMIVFFVVVAFSAFKLPGVQGNIKAYTLGLPFWILTSSVIPGFIISAIYVGRSFFPNHPRGRLSDSSEEGNQRNER